jgi:hypothetical protein
LKNKLKKNNHITESSQKDSSIRKLTKKTIQVNEVKFSKQTSLERGVLTIREGIEENIIKRQSRIKNITVKILKPNENDFFVNSNLDYSPIACKVLGEIGEGITHQLGGVTVMLTGVEDKSSFQPSNIGSSEGIFKNQVVLDMEGTPKSTDTILHIDVLFEEGEGRSAEGIQQAHEAADMIVNEIRQVMKEVGQNKAVSESFYDIKRPGKPKIVLVKIVSGLGNMYDTSLFPNEPGGYIGSHQMMDIKNMPIYLTPNQCRDGAIHSLL